MLNETIESKLNESEKVTYAKLAENYWQASDELEFAQNDTEWCLLNNCSKDDAAKYKRIAWDNMQVFEAKMRRKYFTINRL